jgi:hypothetical protein
MTIPYDMKARMKGKEGDVANEVKEWFKKTIAADKDKAKI